MKHPGFARYARKSGIFYETIPQSASLTAPFTQTGACENSLSKKSVLHAVPVYTAGQRLPLEGKLAAKPTDEVANKKLGKSRNFCQKSRISTSSAQCAHWAPSPQGGRLEKAFPLPRGVVF